MHNKKQIILQNVLTLFLITIMASFLLAKILLTFYLYQQLNVKGEDIFRIFALSYVLFNIIIFLGHLFVTILRSEMQINLIKSSYCLICLQVMAIIVNILCIIESIVSISYCSYYPCQNDFLDITYFQLFIPFIEFMILAKFIHINKQFIDTIKKQNNYDFI